MKYVGVVFNCTLSKTTSLHELTRMYEFKTDLDLKEGDCVVCDTSRGYSVGSVVNSNLGHSAKATKWVVCNIDIETHRRRLERESKEQMLLAKMEIRRREIEKTTLYEMLAQKDDEMKDLLEQLKGLNGEIKLLE